MKKRKLFYNKIRDSKGKIIAIAAAVLFFGYTTHYILDSYVPVNSQMVFVAPTNIHLKTVKTINGYSFASQSAKGSRFPMSGDISPTITVNKGNLVSIHVINLIKNGKGPPSQHNLNIDTFNVHSETLGYFQSDTITFLADKKGTFEYYCSIHPEMKGKMIVK